MNPLVLGTRSAEGGILVRDLLHRTKVQIRFTRLNNCMSKVQVQCTECLTLISKWPYEYKHYINKQYTCKSCIKKRIVNKSCEQCGKVYRSSVTENRRFCTKSCAAIMNNSKRDGAFYKSKKTKQAQCMTCNTLIIINVHASSKKTHCGDCRELKRKNRAGRQNILYRNASQAFAVNNFDKISYWRNKIKYREYVCTQCGKTFEHFRKKKTCSNHCRTIACVAVRTYQNGSRKPVWYFNINENRNVLLESSWEVKVAKLLDSYNIRWTRPAPIEWIDASNIVRLYFPDFYLPAYDMYLDPKNPYCLVKDKEKLSIVSKKIKLIYGDINTIFNFIETLPRTNLLPR